MKKIKILNQLHENYLVAVVRGKSKDDAIAAVQQMIEGGIYNIEITFTTPQEEVIRHLMRQAMNISSSEQVLY